MIGAFSFNGVEAEYFNLVCRSVKRPLLPAAKVKRLELAGSSGVYDFDDSEYSLRQVTMRIVYIGTNYQELRTRARGIAAWLGLDTWGRLILNDEPDKYYLAKVTDEVGLQSLWESGTADIVFDCQPFAMSITETNIAFQATGSVIRNFTNIGTRVINYKSPQGSKFLITINGAWTSLSISMNGSTLNYLASGSGILAIDSVNMEVNLGGVNKFSSLTGDIDTFFKVLYGNNIFSISGVSLNANVAINYIPMWL